MGRIDEQLAADLARRAKDDLKLYTRLAWPLVEPTRYIPGRHIDAVCEHLEAVARRQITRLIINLPVRHTKSLPASIMFPTWVWASDPSHRFITASSDMTLAERFSGFSRDIVESEWFQTHFDARLKPDQNARRLYRTTANGERKAVSAQGKVTGSGGDTIMIDDPLDSREAPSAIVRESINSWYWNTLRNRLNDPDTGAIVVIMQRLHENDLTGFLLREEPNEWDHLCLPARFEPDHPFPVRSSLGFKDWRTERGELLAPERISEEGLRKLATPGSYAEAGQLQQNPSPRGGGLIKVSEITIIEPHEVPKLRRKVRRWDLAATEGGGDWTTGALIGERADGMGYVILDMRRVQYGPGRVRQLIEDVAETESERTQLVLPQDPGAAGKSQVHDLADRLAKYSPRFDRESTAKEARAEPFAAQVEVGRVWMVRGSWNEALLHELELFPMGLHDDQVDACSGAVNFMIEDPGPALVKPSTVPMPEA